MELTFNRKGKEIPIQFEESAIERLTTYHIPMIHIRDILNRNQTEIEEVEIGEEFMIVDDCTLVGINAEESVQIQRVLLDVL